MENILVAGANGTTGKKIVNLLKESQYFNPIAMVRKEEQIPFFEAKNVDTVLADLTEDVDNAFSKPVDKVIFAAGSKGKNLINVDQEGAKKLVDASINNKVKKFVMLSSIGAENPDTANQLKDYLQAKHNADEYLKSTDLNYSIVRPGTLTNDPAENKIELKHHLENHGEISRNDVAQTLVRVLNDDTATRATFEIIKGETLIGEALDKLSN